MAERKISPMLKTNIITRTYQIILRTPSGATARASVDAESPESARLKAPCPHGWELLEVVPI